MPVEQPVMSQVAMMIAFRVRTIRAAEGADSGLRLESGVPFHRVPLSPCPLGGGPGDPDFNGAAIAGSQEDCRVPSSDRATLTAAPDATVEACRGRTN